MLGSAQGGHRRALLLQLLHELRALVEGRGGLGAAPARLRRRHLRLATVLIPALQAGVVGIRLAALPALGRAGPAVQAAAAVGLHGGGDEVGAGAGDAALRVVAEGAAQRGRGAEVPQVVGAGGDVLPVGVQPRVLPVGTVAGLLRYRLLPLRVDILGLPETGEPLDAASVLGMPSDFSRSGRLVWLPGLWETPFLFINFSTVLGWMIGLTGWRL